MVFTPPFQESGIFGAFLKLFGAIRPDQAALKRIFFASRWLLGGLPFLTLFFPRIHLAAIGAASVDLRGEDFLIPVLLFLTFLILASGRRAIEVPSVERSFLAFLVVAQISVFYALALGTVDKPFLSLLYLLKWFEYFLVFFIALQTAAHADAARFFMKCFFLLGIVVACYGYY